MTGKRFFSPARFLYLGLNLLALTTTTATRPALAEGTSVVGIIGPSPQVPLVRSANVDYKINLFREYYFFYRPENYSSSQSFGLLVYVPPFDVMTKLPPGWSAILDKHRMFCLIPQRAGNTVKEPRRTGLAILGALAIMQKYKTDSSRIFVGGFSGGARTAGEAAFFQSDLFKGTVQNCGADFYKAVPHKLSSNWQDMAGNPYGVIREATAQEVANAKDRVRFALVTGVADFRHGNMLDLYNGGFKAEGFKSKLFDVPGMGHDHCSADTLDKVLSYLEGAQ